MPEILNLETKIPELGGLIVGDFWAWAYSDILANTARRILAEFLVGVALDAVESLRPTGREDFDLRYRDKKVEVKASRSTSRAGTKIGPLLSTSASRRAKAGTQMPTPTIQDACGLRIVEQDRNRANVLDANKRESCVLSTQRTNEEIRHQKSVGLRKIRSMTHPVRFGQLRESANLALLKR